MTLKRMAPNTEFSHNFWENSPEQRGLLVAARTKFNALHVWCHNRFTPDGQGRVFGSMAVRITGDFWLVTPREKGHRFTSKDAVIVHNKNNWVDNKIVSVHNHPNAPKVKAALNAPLLIRSGDVANANVVLHLHEQLPDVPIVPYAPPGTERDNNREIPGPVFNIKNHGFIQTFTDILG